jgi:hypothetical protein
MKAALAIGLAIFFAYLIDQTFFYGSYTDPIIAMFRSMEHGFGWG